MLKPEESTLEMTPSSESTEMCQTIDQCLARIYLLEQYILLTEGPKKLEKLRKRLRKSVNMTVESVGVSLLEKMDHYLHTS